MNLDSSGPAALAMFSTLLTAMSDVCTFIFKSLLVFLQNKVLLARVFMSYNINHTNYEHVLMTEGGV